MLLAGDIGGTKTNLAIFSTKDELRTPLKEETLPSARYASLEELIHDFLADTSFTIECACFGVPGPVMGGKAKITNLPWLLDVEQLQCTLDIPTVGLLNDLTAMAHGVPLLGPADLATLNVGEPHALDTMAVIAPGTGLGEAFLTWEGTRYQAHPSEGGHVDFAPTNALEIGLLSYLLQHYEHVSYELVCSGIGLPHIYAYLKETQQFSELAWVSKKLTEVDDGNPIIFQAALQTEEPSPLSSATLKTFAAILGAEAGNMALKVLATGGVFLGGGIPPRILSFLQDDLFMRAFFNKGRFSALLARVPVHVILNPKVALLGAAYHGFEMM
jgi:glucokinase